MYVDSIIRVFFVLFCFFCGVMSRGSWVVGRRLWVVRRASCVVRRASCVLTSDRHREFCLRLLVSYSLVTVSCKETEEVIN